MKSHQELGKISGWKISRGIVFQSTVKTFILWSRFFDLPRNFIQKLKEVS